MRSLVTMMGLVMLLTGISSAVAANTATDSSSVTKDGSNAKYDGSCDKGDGLDSRRFTFWLGGPAVLDYRPGNSGLFTFGVGFGPVEVSNSSSNLIDSTTGDGVTLSVIGEAFYYPNQKANGLAFNVRAGSANSVYFAPGIFYVSRPKGSICGRFGFMVPIGGGAKPFLPEVAIGFRF